MTYVIHLCPAGWLAYDAYCSGSATWAAYLKHRRDCPDCSKPKGRK